MSDLTKEFIKENIEYEVVQKLMALKMTISFAESCTGGLLASTIINVPGASNVISESYVTYSTESKIKILGVSQECISSYGVYSKHCAIQMAMGLKKISDASVCVSVTGHAGGNDDPENGNYFSCVFIKDKQIIIESHVNGSRNEVRKGIVNEILNRVLIELNSLN